MATINKTTLQRYNGTDWDSIYFATSADIVSMGVGFTAKADTTGFKIGDGATVIEATDNVNTLINKIIDRLATIDTNVLPKLEKGELTSVSASIITGVLARANLPADVSGKWVEVATEDAKGQLTSTQVNQGDIVKVTGGAIYMVSGFAAESGAPEFKKITDDTSDIAWSRITGKPTTLQGYGITDAVAASEKATAGGAAAAGKVATANAEGKLAFDVTGDAGTLGGHAASYFATAEALGTTNNNVKTNTDAIAAINEGLKSIDASTVNKGTLPLSVIPKAALERVYVAANDAALATITKEQVQNGDTVKVKDTDTTIGKMYLVVDEDKLGTTDYMQGLMPYSAGTAAAVDWSGVTNRPTTLTGYGITDAVSSSDVVTEPAANKLLKLNADGKLPASITGDAMTLESHPASYFATATALSTLDAAYKKTVEEVADLASAVLGDVTTPPSQDPDNDAYTGDVEEAEEKEDVDWAKGTHGALSWTVVSKNDDEAILMYNSGLGSHTVTTKEGLEKTETIFRPLLDELSDDAEALLISSPFVPNNGEIESYELDATKLKFAPQTTFEEDPAPEGEAVNWWLSDGYYVDTNGTVQEGEPEPTETSEGQKQAYVRFFIKLDLSNPDSATLLDRIAALENTTSTMQADIAALQAGTTIQALAASKITGRLTRDQLPEGIGSTVHNADDMEEDYLENVHKGDWVKTSDGKLYIVIDEENLDDEDGYMLMVDIAAASISWNKITGKPTTLSGYGITDAVSTADVVVDALTNPASADGKVVKVDSTDHKMHVNIAGDAATVGGHAPEYFATAAALEALSLLVPQLLSSVSDLPNPKVGQMVMIPITSTSTDSGSSAGSDDDEQGESERQEDELGNA